MLWNLISWWGQAEWYAASLQDKGPATGVSQEQKPAATSPAGDIDSHSLETWNTPGQGTGLSSVVGVDRIILQSFNILFMQKTRILISLTHGSACAWLEYLSIGLSCGGFCHSQVVADQRWGWRMRAPYRAIQYSHDIFSPLEMRNLMLTS